MLGTVASASHTLPVSPADTLISHTNVVFTEQEDEELYI